MPVRLAIRVDASTGIGSGHVKRCLALARAAADSGASVVFLVRRLDVDASGSIRAQGFDCLELPAPGPALFPVDPAIPHAAWARVSSETDARETLAALDGRAPDWVVVDHYGFDARWHRAVRRGCGARIAAIDDLADRHLDVDVIVDHNQAPDHRLKYAKVNETKAPVLGGPHHALLGERYADAPRYEFSPHVRSVGIFMGGADTGDFSRRALEAVHTIARFDGPAEIVTTRSNPHLASLQALVQRTPNSRVTLDLPDLCDFFARHDLHVGAGGGATWERCCIGAPALAIIVADNQRQVLAPLQDREVLHAVPEVEPDATAIAREFLRVAADADWRSRMSLNGRHLVDGRGALRVADYLIETCTQ